MPNKKKKKGARKGVKGGGNGKKAKAETETVDGEMFGTGLTGGSAPPVSFYGSKIRCAVC